MALITIKRIELINYRQFRNCKIDLPFNPQKPFNIIEGKNGFGKSNLLNAITWCFYGIEEHLKKVADGDAEPIPNTQVINELNEGERQKASVEIILETKKGNISIKRELGFGKRNGIYFQDKEDNLTILEQNRKGNWDKQQFPTYRINQILPHIVSKFFFFDGEQFRRFFEDINPKKVKKAIFDISQLFLIEYSIKDMTHILTDLRKPDSSKNPELKDIKSDIDFYNKNIPLLEKEIDDYQEQIEIARKDIVSIDNDLKLSNIDLVKQLVSQRDSLQVEIAEANKEIDFLENDIAEYIMENSLQILTIKTIKDTSKLLTTLKLEGEIPTKIKDTFIKDLLDVKKECICGTDLISGKPREKLLKMLEVSRIKDFVSEEANDLRYELNAMGRNAQRFHNVSKQLISDKAEKEAKLEVKEKSLKEISIKLVNYEHIKDEDINQYERNRKIYVEKIEEYSKKIGAFKVNLEDYENMKKEKENLYDRIEKSITKNKRKIAKKDFIKEGKEILEKIKEDLMSELREEIEKNTKSYFNKLVTAKVSGKLEIDSEYRISIIKRGFSALKSLSVGETLLLALAFMGALRKVSGFVAPLIIDTPLAPIDKEYRENLIIFLSEALEKTQIILLMKDTENTESVQNKLSPKTNNMKKLVYDKTLGISDVIDYE